MPSKQISALIADLKRTNRTVATKLKTLTAALTKKKAVPRKKKNRKFKAKAAIVRGSTHTLDHILHPNVFVAPFQITHAVGGQEIVRKPRRKRHANHNRGLRSAPYPYHPQHNKPKKHKKNINATR